MRVKAFILFALILLTGCDDEPVSLAGRHYNHALFDSEEECLTYQSQGYFINCNQVVKFKEDQKMEILFTDILYRGKYFVLGKKIHISVKNAYESPKEFTFSILSDDRIKLDGPGTVWELQ